MRSRIIAASAALMMVTTLFAASPAGAVPPPPTLMCANDFSTTDLTGWNRLGGAWSVAGGVYQQTRTVSSARSWFQAEWLGHNVQARVKLASASRPSGFVALAVAVRGANTSYRLVLQAKSVVELHYVNNGVVTVLASQALPITKGTWYAIQMGVTQTNLFALIDGAWMFGGYVPVPVGGHYIGGVGFATAHATGAFDDISVITYGPSAEPKCPTTPA